MGSEVQGSEKVHVQARVVNTRKNLGSNYKERGIEVWKLRAR